MAVQVLIRRKIMETKAKEVAPLIVKLRSLATIQPGYISGETLVSHDDPQDVLVIGTWQDMESWQAWKENPKRKEFEAMLELYQESPTSYEAFMLGGPPQL